MGQSNQIPVERTVPGAAHAERPGDAVSHPPVLFLAPRGGDAAHAGHLLQTAGLSITACATLNDLVDRLDEDTGAVVVAQEVLHEAGLPALREHLQRQPPWSALPVVVLTNERRLTRTTARLLNELEAIPGVVFLARPLRGISLISVLRNALQARQHQYRVRDLLTETERAVHQRDRFLALLGHELRNPLAPLRHMLDALRLQDQQPPLFRDGLTMMGRQVDQLTHLVDDLLDAARISQGRITLRPTRLALEPVIQQAVASVQPLLDRQRHRFELALPTGALWVEADETRLVQILTNLLGNAARYTPDGGHIVLAVTRQADRLLIRVRDNGIGIPAQEQTTIFEPFSQTDGGRSHSQHGLGLGLNLVKQLVELHGWDLSLHSDGEDRGSEFTIDLPLQAAEDMPGSGADGAGVDHSILVVDDNREAADTLAMLLRALGHRTRVAYGGRQALDTTENRCPHIALLDLNMPGLDGYELASRLRQRWGERAPRLIAVTGHGDPERLEEAGFEHHLLKPVGMDALLEVLRTRN